MKGPATVLNFWKVSNSNMLLGCTWEDSETVMKPFNFYRDETHASIHAHPGGTWIPRILLPEESGTQKANSLRK